MVDAGATKCLTWQAHPSPSRQMQPNEEDGDFNVMFQLQRKEMLQQLLLMLGSAVVSSPQMAKALHRERQPCGLPREG